MAGEKGFSGNTSEDEEVGGGLKERVSSYIAEEAYESGVRSLEAAFEAALHERARQLEQEERLSPEEALAEAKKEFDAAYEKSMRSRRDQ